MNQESKNLWLAVIFAVIGAGLLYSHIQEKNKEVTKKFGAKTTVVQAKADIGEMVPINETHIEFQEMPIEFVPPGAVQDPNEIIGMVALVSFRKGELILKNKVTMPSPLTGLSRQIAPGKRAVTVPATEMSGVAKLLKPGDRIDLIGAVSIGSGQNKRTEVKPVMQNIPILATGTRISNELPVLYERNKKGNEVIIRNLSRDTKYSNITLEVTPQQAQTIIYIINQNPKDLTMVLRHPTDTGPVPVRSTTAESILGRKRRLPASKTPAAARKKSGTRGF